MFIFSFINSHSFIHFYWSININYNIIFSLPTNSKNCIKRVAFIQKYTHRIILNLQELWPRTVFTFYNGKGCVGGGKSVLKINSMTWKINRQKKICLGSPTRWTPYFGFDVRLPLVFNKVQQFWMALHSFGWTFKLRALHCARIDIQIR